MIPVILIWALAALNLFPESSSRRSLDECIEIGLSNSKIIQESRIAASLTRERVAEARAGFLPSLTLKAAYQRLSETEPATISLPSPSTGSVEFPPSIANQYSLGASLKQPLFTGFRLLSSVSKARNAADRSLQDYETVRLNLIFHIKMTYYNLAKAVESQKVVEESLDQVSAHLQDVKNYFTQGLATNHDVLNADMKLADTTLLQIESENSVKLASVNLSILLGLPMGEKIIPVLPEHHKGAGPGDLEGLIQEALQKRPEVMSALYQIRESESDVSIAQSGWYPNIFLTGGYQYARPNPRIFPQKDEFISAWDVGVSVSIDPAMFGAVASRTSQARENLARTHIALGRLRDDIRVEVVESYLRLEKDGKAIEVAKLMVAQAEENLRIVKEKFGTGLSRPTELLDADVDLQQARLRYTRAVIDFEIDRAALERATGR